MAMQPHIRESLPRRMAWTALIGACVAILFAKPGNSALGQEPPSVVKIGNLSSGPFRYQVRRAIGIAWTDTFILPANEFHEYSTQPTAQRTEFATIGVHDRPGVLFIQFSQPPGFMRLKLKAGSTYWYTVDANGRRRLFEANNLDLALRLKAEFDNLPGEDAEALRQVIIRLEANHVLHLPRGVEIQARTGPEEADN